MSSSRWAGSPFFPALRLLLIAGTIAGAIAISRPRDGTDRTEIAGLRALADFTIEERIPKRHSTLHTLRRGDTFVKVETIREIDESSARVLSGEGRTGLEALLADGLSPYPGDISRQIARPEELRPRFITREVGGSPRTYCILPANARLGYGVSAPGDFAYISLAGWLYCPAARTFHKVRIFAPRGRPEKEIEDLFLALDCP